MATIIKWNNEGIETRRAVAELMGWRTKQGKITRTGERIAKTNWENLTPSAREVLTRHGIEPGTEAQPC